MADWKRTSEEMKPSQEYERPEVQLSGEDGNVFFIIGRVSKALKRAGVPEMATEYQEKATSSGCYDEVLALTMEYVDTI